MVQENINLVLPSGRTCQLDLSLQNPNGLVDVFEVSERVLLSGGKLWRPKLCFLVGTGVGLTSSQIAPFARVAELVHAASLAHDDVLDEATVRRDAPTLNALLTQKRAVLAGDLLLARAVSELCTLGNSRVTQRMAEVVERLSTGEWLQLDWKGRWDTPSDIVDKIRYFKTGCLMEWCCETPFLLSGGTAGDCALSRSVGRKLGEAFQLIDDCIDFAADTGKQSFKDWTEGNVNSVLVAYREFEGEIATSPEQFKPLSLKRAILTIRNRASEILAAAGDELKQLENADRDFSELKNLIQAASKRKR